MLEEVELLGVGMQIFLWRIFEMLCSMYFFLYYCYNSIIIPVDLTVLAIA
jgi:hypothetical protein